MRISRTLEGLIAQLNLMRERNAQLAAGSDDATEISEYREVRQRALRYRWYLEVQREALGLRRHDVLDEFYKIP